MTRILLVDDDISLSEMLKEYLEQEAFTVETAQDGEQALERVFANSYDLVVLDVMMPRMNGIEALRCIRQQSRIPVVMLTAKDDDVDRIIGLELGADDYVPKPCSPRELTARIRAILRRVQGQSNEDGHITAGALSIWPEKRKAFWNDQLINLTSTEFNLLEVLIKNVGRIVSKQELSENGLGRSLTPYDRSLDVHLSSIRHKLRQAGALQSTIETVRGIGYQLVKE
ncbi:MAG: response regulator transcription factor [Pseudomonadota bacterium]